MPAYLEPNEQDPCCRAAGTRLHVDTRKRVMSMDSSPDDRITAKAALQRLVHGNLRFSSGNPSHPHQSEERRAAVLGGQVPFAAVLSCSDSRVPPEIIFDQGVGDLFVIRVAGNIVTDEVLGSIQFATEKLGVALIAVLGHQNCGAVEAAVGPARPMEADPTIGVWTWQSGYLGTGSYPASGHLGQIIQAILPAVEEARRQSGDLLENAVKANINLSVGRIKSSISTDRMTGRGPLAVLGAYYHLNSGQVSWLATPA